MAFPSGFTAFVPSGQTSRTAVGLLSKLGASNNDDDDAQHNSKMPWHFWMVIIIFVASAALFGISAYKRQIKKEYRGIITDKFRHERKHKHFTEDQYFITLRVDSIGKSIQIGVIQGTWNSIEVGSRLAFDLSINDLENSGNKGEHIVN